MGHPGMSRQPGDGRNNPSLGGPIPGGHPPFVQGFGNTLHDRVHAPYLGYGGNVIGEFVSESFLLSILPVFYRDDIWIHFM